MCSTTVMSIVESETSRRTFLRSMSAAAIGVGAAAVAVRAESQSTGLAVASRSVRFEKIVDCTHVLEPDIPNYFRLNMEITPLLTVEENGVFVNRLIVPEHYGTHFDTPAHFILNGITGESIQPEQLVGPLVVIDIADRASQDANTEITVADLEQWEWRNGRIPSGAFVAMYSNWAARWPTPAYLNEVAGTYNFPGFGGEAARFLTKERDIIGIGCDSHSLDVGPSTSYPRPHCRPWRREDRRRESDRPGRSATPDRAPQAKGNRRPSHDLCRWTEDPEWVRQPRPSSGARVECDARWNGRASQHESPR